MATNSFKKTSSQNLGLLNFYQKRSYQCEISMLGNALIQPGMYFNLTNVPLFAGSYKIESVSHVIAPGTFETRFTGLRQKIYSYPLQSDYLQSINKNVLKKVQSKLPKAESTSNSQPTNVIAQTNEKVQNAKDEKVAPEVQTCAPTTPYERYATVDPVMSKYSYTQMIDLITNEVVNAPTQVETIKKVMFVIIFIESSDSSGNELISYNNNFAGVRLVKNWGQVGETYFDTGKYVCLQGINDQISVPYAVFKSINDNIKFLYENIRGRVATMIGTSIQDFSQIYVDYWQKIQNVYDSMTVQQREVIDNKTKTALALLTPIDKPAEPSPLIAVYNYTTPLDGDKEFKDIIIYLDPAVDGDRKIFLVDFDVSTPSKETDCYGSGSGLRFEDDGAKYFGKYNKDNKEYVAFIVDRNDLLREIDCDSASAQRDGYNNVGVYNFLINLYTKPYLPNGSLDTSRSDVYEGFPVTIEVKQL